MTNEEWTVELPEDTRPRSATAPWVRPQRLRDQLERRPGEWLKWSEHESTTGANERVRRLVRQMERAGLAEGLQCRRVDLVVWVRVLP